MIYDTIVIGRGPAGISCAVYLKRFNLNPLIIAKDNGTLEQASYIDNYYGFDHISGHDLAMKGIEQAKALDIEMIDAEVVDIQFGAKGYHVKCTAGEFEAKTIFLAMGKKKAMLTIPTRNKFDGSGVSYCAVCDGFFYKNKKIGLVGAGAFMLQEYSVLKNFSKDIIVFTNGEELKEEVEATVVTDKILELIGDKRLEAVKTANGQYPVDGLFIALGSQSGMSLSYHLGLELDEKGNLKVNNFQTNLPGIFAGGDIIGGFQQASKASADGALASLQIKSYLDSKK